MIEIRREKADTQRIDNIDFVQGTLADDSLKGAPYDAVKASVSLTFVYQEPDLRREVPSFG